MNNKKKLVVFTLNDQCYALYLSVVGRIVRMVETTPLPKAPEIVLGVINVKGQIIPVVNIRRRFSLLEREIDLSDQLIIAQTPRRAIALIVDSVSGVIEFSEQDIITAEKILPGMEYIEGVLKLKDGMILIHDLDRFLSFEEEKMLDYAMKKNQKSKK
ncbi:MAG: purine-binding chemotaxis protein CheW [Candidatus Cloacimonetes bacterium]|nr:purine-binding chemotaxis protein CheW [Candidatus Cloacimonadota bacterium]